MKLISGYGEVYDPSETLNKLDSAHDEAINELWENLYHQGDVGTASYFAVPTLVEKGELSLVGAIEVARNEQQNPELPDSLKLAYFEALQLALLKTPSSEEHCQGYYVIHASVNNQRNLAKALNLLSVEEMLDEYA